MILPTKLLLHTDFDTFSDTSHGLKPEICAAVGLRANCQPPSNNRPEPKKPSGSRACNPIAIQDDDEPDPTEVYYIDLDNDDEASIQGHYTARIKQAADEAHDLGLQSLARSHSPYSRKQGADPARCIERVTQPLFRALTKDDLPASSAQSLPETRGIGFKAWYETHETHHTGNAVPETGKKWTRQNPSITLFNEERTKNTAKGVRDAPQFAMSVLKSKHKRTIGELGYNELISPAQIESPSEKLARIAKRRRHHQERRDPWSQNGNAGDAQSTINLLHVPGHGNCGMTGESFDVTVSPIVPEPLGTWGIVAATGEERNSVVCERSPVNTSESQRNHATTQRRKDHSDGHTYGICSLQTTAPDCGAQENEGKSAAYPSGSANRKPNYRKPRVGGLTNVCGVFSPEKKPPVKRSSHGDFHCPRCDSQFTRPRGVNYHFEDCIAKYGNPSSLRWDDHPSLGGVGKRIATMNENERRVSSPARTSKIQENSASIMHNIEPASRPATTVDKVAPSPASNFQAPGLLNLPETRHITEEQSSDSCDEAKRDNQASIVEYRATGGKGLSAETLKSFREAGNWDRGIDLNESADEAQDDETEIPSIAYRYFVLKRDWLETEEDAIESSMGPYHTMNEANAVAKTEVQCPQIDGLEGIQSMGWSYYYKQDEHGMQTHMATVLDINVEAVVHRGTLRSFGLTTYSPEKMADSRCFQSLRQPLNGFRYPYLRLLWLRASTLSTNCNGYHPLTAARVQLHCTANRSHMGFSLF